LAAAGSGAKSMAETEIQPTPYITVEFSSRQAFVNAMAYLGTEKSFQCHTVQISDDVYVVTAPPELQADLEAEHPNARPPVQDIAPVQGVLMLSRTPSTQPDKYSSLLDEAEELINADPETKLWYNRALTWKRNSPFVTSIAAKLNLTDDQVDDLFRAAKQIEE
jgi:hypothetical protein